MLRVIANVAARSWVRPSAAVRSQSTKANILSILSDRLELIELYSYSFNLESSCVQRMRFVLFVIPDS